MRFIGWVVSLMIAVLVFVSAVGCVVWSLSAPWYTRLAAPAKVEYESAGLSHETMNALASDVAVFVNSVDALQLPSMVEQRTGFDEATVAHLLDVRTLVLESRRVTIVAIVALILLSALFMYTNQEHAVSTGLMLGGLALFVAVIISGSAGSTDFGAFFTRFHKLFFKSGTWTFPTGSLVIQLFPEAFWKAAGTLTGFLTALLGVGSFVVGNTMRRFR